MIIFIIIHTSEHTYDAKMQGMPLIKRMMMMMMMMHRMSELQANKLRASGAAPRIIIGLAMATSSRLPILNILHQSRVLFD